MAIEMEQQNIVFQKARNFIYRNARPLELARWRYHFEKGSAEDVLVALSAYQNSDGGFGYGLEPDFWNPASTPIATWSATTRLWELGFTDGAHPVVQGILRYLDSGKDFDGRRWYNTVPGNNDYPHAVWWHCDDAVGVPGDNPTVSLLGFALRFAKKESSLYQKAAAMAAETVRYFLEKPADEMHLLNNYLNFLGWCEGIMDFDLFDLNAFRKALYQAIDNMVCKEEEKWYTEYVCKPSSFFEPTGRILQILPKSLCLREAELILQKQLPDGSYPVTWIWYNEYKEYEISANWWKSSILLDNMLYIAKIKERVIWQS